jgi:hypothetical protein
VHEISLGNPASEHTTESIRASQTSSRPDLPAEILDAHLHVALMEAKDLDGMESLEGISAYCDVSVIGPHVSFEDKSREERSSHNILRWCDEFTVKRLEMDSDLCIVVREVSRKQDGDHNGGSDGSADGNADASSNESQATAAPSAYGFEGGRRRRLVPDASQRNDSFSKTGNKEKPQGRELGRVVISIRTLYERLQAAASRKTGNKADKDVKKLMDNGLDTFELARPSNLVSEDKWFELQAHDDEDEENKDVSAVGDSLDSSMYSLIFGGETGGTPAPPNGMPGSQLAKASHSRRSLSNKSDGRGSISSLRSSLSVLMLPKPAGKLRLILSFGPRESGREYDDVDQYVTRGILREILQKDDHRNRKVAQRHAMQAASKARKIRKPSMLSLPSFNFSFRDATMYVPRLVHGNVVGMINVMSNNSVIPVHMFPEPPPLPSAGELRVVYGGEHALQRPLIAVKHAGVGRYSRDTPLRELGGMQQETSVAYGDAFVERLYEKAREKDLRDQEKMIQQKIAEKKMIHIHGKHAGDRDMRDHGAAENSARTPVPAEYHIQPFVKGGYVPPPVRPPTPVHARRTDGGFA